MSLRNRLIIILYIISFTVSLFIFTAAMKNVTVDIEYTSYSDAVYSGNKVYLAQNVAGSGRLFRMDTDGDVLDMFSSTEAKEERIEAIDVTGEGVYALLSTMQSAEEGSVLGSETGVAVFYRIVSLDQSLKLQYETETFVLGDDMISGFSVDDTGMYLTVIAPDGSYASVYGISKGELKRPDSLSGNQVAVEGIRKRLSNEGRFFVQARYYDGELYIRSDSEPPAGIFGIDETAVNAVSHMRLSPGQLFKLYGKYFLIYIAALLIWFILLYGLIRMFENRNRMFYYVAIAEAVLAIIVGICVYTIVNRTSEARTTEHSRFAVISLIGLADEAGINDYVDFSAAGFYDSDTYHGIAGSLSDFVKREGNSDIFYDVLVVRLRDSIVMASASGRNLQHITTIFGNNLDSVSTDIYRGNRISYEELYVDDQSCRAIGVADDDTVPDYALLGIINNTGTDANVWADNTGALLLALLAFAIGSLLIIAVWYLLNRDMMILDSALSDTALGKELPERPAVIGRDVKDMWDSLSEINKRVEELQYSKLRILEAYYRFAPKNVEKILQRDSILEVRNGDSIAVRGTVVTISIMPRKNNGAKSYDRVVSSIGEYQKNHGCLIVGKSPDMSSVQLFLQDYEKQSTAFLSEMFSVQGQEHDGYKLSASLFYDRCNFAVVGNEDETMAFFDSDRKNLINDISDISTKLELGIVISEDVREREQINGPLRFIGYIGCGSVEGGVRLYEVLDAYPARIRSRKIAILDKFEEALNAFYEKDFYISRTLFSDILKEIPDDALVKWYVFESDRYLNENADDSSFMNLHV
ncbi:MAG: hypothetical protein K6G12_02460 [Lachnospiraceae bacterium]|nr:hypothetical protein [Lachnospiraceae bacterium]